MAVAAPQNYIQLSPTGLTIDSCQTGYLPSGISRPMQLNVGGTGAMILTATGVVVKSLAGYGAGIVDVSNTGQLSWGTLPAGGVQVVSQATSALGNATSLNFQGGLIGITGPSAGEITVSNNVVQTVSTNYTCTGNSNYLSLQSMVSTGTFKITLPTAYVQGNEITIADTFGLLGRNATGPICIIAPSFQGASPCLILGHTGYWMSQPYVFASVVNVATGIWSVYN